jgi:hypothetical protein
MAGTILYLVSKAGVSSSRIIHSMPWSQPNTNQETFLGIRGWCLVMCGWWADFVSEWTGLRRELQDTLNDIAVP